MLITLFERFVIAHERIADALERMHPLPYPEPFLKSRPLNERHVSVVKKEFSMDIQQFCLELSARTDDVARRTVTMEIDEEAELPASGSIPVLQTREVLGKDAANTGEDLSPTRDIATVGAFELPEGEAAVVTTIAYDNAGNASVPTVQNILGSDLTAPVAEGELTVKTLAERTEA